MKLKFDLIVIGTGSGLDVANAVAQKGLKVAIVEKGPMGGTCLNRGCIPSKMLLHVADIVETINNAEKFGITVKDQSVDFSRIVSEINDYVDGESKGIETFLSRSQNPRLFKGIARFIGEKELSVNNILIKGDRILIAAGARPHIPNIPGLEESGYITSTEALRLPRLPKSMTIIGGGYIAVEMAHFFGTLGSVINIIQRGDRLLTREDDEISQKFTEEFSGKYNVYLSSETKNINRNGKTYSVTLENRKSRQISVVESDELLIATGIVPNTDILRTELCGIALDERGFIKVDDFLETNVSGVFAIGDSVGKYMLKHSANLEAQFSYYNIIDPERKISVNYRGIPHAIFTSPQLAAVGLTEEEVKVRGLDYAVGICNYADTGMGAAIKDNSGYVKIIVERNTGEILGCHIIGTDASVLIHEVVVAMQSGDGSISNITNAVHAHPALSEVVLRAAISARKAGLSVTPR